MEDLLDEITREVCGNLLWSAIQSCVEEQAKLRC